MRKSNLATRVSLGGIALLAAALAAENPALATWRVQQVNDPDERVGWVTRIVTNDQATPYIMGTQTDRITRIYELLPNDVLRQTTIPDGLFDMDLAATPDRSDVGAVRVEYDSVTGEGSLQFLEQTPQGNWSSITVQSDVGGGSGGVALAFDADHRPLIAYQRLTTQSIELATRDEAGVWTSTPLAAGSPFQVSQYVDLVLDAAGQPHVLYSTGAGLTHAWQNDGAWQTEPIAASGNPLYLGDGAAFDRQGRLHVATWANFDTSGLHVRHDSGWFGYGVDPGFPIFGGFHIQGADRPPDLALDVAGRPHLAPSPSAAGSESAITGSTAPRGAWKTSPDGAASSPAPSPRRSTLPPTGK